MDLDHFNPFAPELTDLGGSCLPGGRQATEGLPPSSGPHRILKDALSCCLGTSLMAQEAEDAGVQNKQLFPGLPLAGATQGYSIYKRIPKLLKKIIIVKKKNPKSFNTLKKINNKNVTSNNQPKKLLTKKRYISKHKDIQVNPRSAALVPHCG